MYILEIHCEAELSKLTNVKVKIIISPLFLSICVIFLQKAMVQYIIVITSDVPIIGDNRLTNCKRSTDAMIDYVLS